MNYKPRLAIVQHGDYREALRVRDDDLPEPYFGMKDSVALTERFVAGTTYRLISVDAPNYRVEREGGELIGLHRPNWPKLSKLPWSWAVWRQVASFRPDYLLMRTGGILAYPALDWAVRNRAQTLVVMAGFMASATRRDRFMNSRLIGLLNHPNVYRAANHRRPAALSTVDAGVDPNKVVAWDFANVPCPAEQPIKSLSDAKTPSILFVGTLKAGKGISDLLEAVILLHQRKFPVRLTVCGDGELRSSLESRAKAIAAEFVTFKGSVDNALVQQEMRCAALVCVPSRSESSEGLPFTITEAFASRTPLVVTDHPSITKLLRDGEGIRIANSGDASSIASTIFDVLTDADQYLRLSVSTQQAFEKVGSDITFDNLLWQWRSDWAACR